MRFLSRPLFIMLYIINDNPAKQGIRLTNTPPILSPADISLSFNVEIASINPMSAMINGMTGVGYFGIPKNKPKPAITAQINDKYRNFFILLSPIYT